MSDPRASALASIMRPEGAVGAYRRAVRITGRTDEIQAEMADDFHHFAVTIGHDGAVIRSIAVESHRSPWVTCPLAAKALDALVGQRLDGGGLARESRSQGCTHMLDLVALALDHAQRGTAHRDYRIEIEVQPDKSLRCRLERDGEALFDWRVRDDVIVGGPLDGLALKPLAKTAADRLSPDDLEAAMALRRAIHISGARGIDLDKASHAGLSGAGPATCYTLLPENRPLALRQLGASRDFYAEGVWPLADTPPAPSKTT
jgi:hypothetical protein